jgi:hypothetical protein
MYQDRRRRIEHNRYDDESQPGVFWLCETCSSSFTLGLDGEGFLTLQRVPEGARVTIYDERPLGQAG